VQPEYVVRIEIDMWATAHHFRRRHRLRLLVSSGAYPRWSSNLGTDESLATGVRMATDGQTIYHYEARPSALVIWVAEGAGCNSR
jgi:hypothetical protein